MLHTKWEIEFPGSSINVCVELKKENERIYMNALHIFFW